MNRQPAFAALTDGTDRYLDRTAVWLACCCALFGLQLTMIVFHVPWRDEWQALQIAVQSPDFHDLFVNLRFEGHPPLWYFVLRGVAALVGAKFALAASSALIALAGQSLILFFSPFSRIDRLLLGFSQFFLFEYFTVSRSLSLGVLLILVVVCLWRTRWAWLAIALLPLCDFQFGVIAALLALLRLRENNLWLPGVFLWLATSAFSAWSVIPHPDFVAANPQRGLSIELSAFFQWIGLVLVPLQWADGMRWNAPPPAWLTPVLSAGSLALMWRLTDHDRNHRALVFAFMAICAIFSITIYFLSGRHIMLIAVMLVAVRWLAADKAGWPGLQRAWLAICAVCGGLTAAYVAVVPFDSSAKAAAAITARQLTQMPWMSFPMEHAQPVAGLTGMAFENPERPCLQTFIRWNVRNPLRTDAELARYLSEKANQRGRFYLLSASEIGEADAGIVLIEKIPPGYNGEAYYLYVVRPDLAVRSSKLSYCAEPQSPLR